MIRSTLRQPWALTLAAVFAIAAFGTASASPRRASADDDALARAVAFETALTTSILGSPPLPSRNVTRPEVSVFFFQS